MPCTFLDMRLDQVRSVRAAVKERVAGLKGRSKLKKYPTGSMQAPAPPTAPDRATAVAFAGVVIIAGVAPVAVRFSNQELPPFFGAGVRFAGATLILLAIVLMRRISPPKGDALVGAVLYGLLSFALAYALAYWALQKVPAATGGLVMASVPLFTFLFAVGHGVEAFRWRGLAGATLALLGIAMLLRSPLNLEVPIPYLLAMIGAAAAAAEAGVVVKMFPPSHPLATNAIAMGVGTVMLLLFSALSREQWVLPSRPTTWFWLVELILLGSVGLFMLYLFVLQKWTASGASYQFVLMPLVTLIFAGALAGERFGPEIAVGGGVVLAGVYVGALSGHRRGLPCPAESEVLAQRCSHV